MFNLDTIQEEFEAKRAALIQGIKEALSQLFI